MVDQKYGNEQIDSKISFPEIPKLDLKEILDKLSLQLLETTGFHLCAINQWDQEKDRTVNLADVGRAAWIKMDGERYPLCEHPITRGVFTSGEPAIIHLHMDQPETAWMEKLGLVSTLIIPLYQKENIIGIAELANTEKFEFSAQEGLQMCEAILQSASGWLTAPLQENPGDELFSLAQELRDALNASACSLTAWLPESEEGMTVIDYSDSFWNYGEGPIYPLKDWMIARKALEQKMPIILVASMPGINPLELEELEMYRALTLAIIPLTINHQPIGFIELYDVTRERTITNEELYSWGALAGQAAIALQNAQLLQIAQQRLEEQIILRRATEVIVSSLESQDILTKLAEQLCNAIGVTSVYINEYQISSVQSTVTAEFISPNAAPEELISDIGAEYSDFDDPDFIKIMDRGEFALSQINSPTITAEEFAHMRKFGAKSILYIPLRTKQKLIGFIELWESRYVREFTTFEINLCQDIAIQAQIALENARLYKLLTDSLTEKNILLQEIHHRVKNNLQIISSLLSLQSGQIDDPEMLEIFTDSRNRIQSIALVHETLYGSNDLSHVDLGLFLTGLVKKISQIDPKMSSKISIKTQIDKITLSLNEAVPLGLLLNELISNSMKHAFRGQSNGTIEIVIEKMEPAGISLMISDNGIGFQGGDVSFNESKSLGLSLVNILVTQLKGELNYIAGEGTRFEISIP